MPKLVSVHCGVAAKAIHLLGGVAGWGYPFEEDRKVSMIVRLRYSNGTSEDHPLINGVHIADYLYRNDVPESKFAFEFEGGQQVRYLSVRPKRTVKIQSVDFVKGEGVTAPVVIAMTVETLQE